MKLLFRMLGIALLSLCLADVRAQTTPSVITMQNAATATGNGTAIIVGVSAAAPGANLGAVGIQITGTFSATITFEATTDGSNWTAVMATELADDSRATTATAAGHYTILYGSAIQVRARISSYSSGTVTIKGRLIPGLTARLTSGGGGGGSGTVTDFSAGDLSPLFTTTETDTTTTPALSFSLTNAAAHKFFGNNTGSTGAPAYVSIGTGDLPTGIPNANLANSSFTLGSTAISLGDTTTTIAGLTLTTPTIASFTNATHNHSNSAGGGQVAIGSGISGLGTGVATFLGTPSSANLATALTDETGGSGVAVFNSTPTIITPSFTTGFTIGGTAATGTIPRGNGTNFIASSFTMAVPGTSGNVLTSDGTNWTSAAPAAASIAVGGAITSGTASRVLFENSSNQLGEAAGFTFDGTSALTLGVAGTSIGSVGFKNATSGTITVQPVTGALGTVTLSLPATTGTLACLACAQTFSAAQSFSSTITQTSASATAFESGPNGGTNPVFRLVNNTGSQATGLSVTGNAAGSGVTLTALSSGSNEALHLVSKGSGFITTTVNGSRVMDVAQGVTQFRADQKLEWASGGLPGTSDLTLARANTGVVRIGNNSLAGTLSSAANTPSQITSDQNNYAPGVGLFQRWSSDASRNVTGLVAGVDGQIAFIWNVGAQNIVLVNESGSSTAANRFTSATGADLTLAGGNVALAQYSTSTSRWLVIKL